MVATTKLERQQVLDYRRSRIDRPVSERGQRRLGRPRSVPVRPGDPYQRAPRLSADFSGEAFAIAVTQRQVLAARQDDSLPGINSPDLPDLVDIHDVTSVNPVESSCRQPAGQPGHRVPDDIFATGRFAGPSAFMSARAPRAAQPTVVPRRTSAASWRASGSSDSRRDSKPGVTRSRASEARETVRRPGPRAP